MRIAPLAPVSPLHERDCIAQGVIGLEKQLFFSNWESVPVVPEKQRRNLGTVSNGFSVFRVHISYHHVGQVTA